MELYRQPGMELTTGDRTGTDDLLYVASAIPPSHMTWCGSACLGLFGLELLYSGLSPSPGLGLGLDPDTVPSSSGYRAVKPPFVDLVMQP